MIVRDLIEKLSLLPHPEGGYFRETYRSTLNIPAESLSEGISDERSLATCIYYLLTHDDFSAFHRIKSDETWHHYSGEALTIYIIDIEGVLRTVTLGNDIQAGQIPQCTIPAGCWFAAQLKNCSGYCLVGCTVYPGFDFRDFEMAQKEELIQRYPHNKEVIQLLTK